MQSARLLFVFLIASVTAIAQQPFIQILGVAQDGGYPHIGCEKACCAPAWQDAAKKQFVVSLALVDPTTKQWWLFEATPDIKEQLHAFQQSTKGAYLFLPTGIFITHAHMGHYTGLMQLGREALGSKQVPVYALPRFEKYLRENGPWSQLVKLNNIQLKQLKTDQPAALTENIQVTAFTVPHRDEYSETAGFKIEFSGKQVLFIPDIDKWEKWNVKIEDLVEQVDVALVDATFYTATELSNRSMSEIPHPLVAETMTRFESKPDLKSRIYFIHFNHTNPLLWNKTEQDELRKQGFNVAETGMIIR
ncbi:MAG TPA: pyrroloquinoline quinone biosynthesis protein PqqB [Cytophagales bacterium]|nr:pyrroloquinoline quinone biosynthesis protein PqqB [Cytophagales bacterium]HRG09713.1 MBL fold metallo-hydrolase [Cyclobacteriaceae bacterium]